MKVWHLVTIVPYILWSIISIKTIMKNGGFNEKSLVKSFGDDRPTDTWFWSVLTCIGLAFSICYIGVELIDWNKELISLDNFR